MIHDPLQEKKAALEAKQKTREAQRPSIKALGGYLWLFKHLFIGYHGDIYILYIYYVFKKYMVYNLTIIHYHGGLFDNLSIGRHGDICCFDGGWFSQLSSCEWSQRLRAIGIRKWETKELQIGCMNDRHDI